MELNEAKDCNNFKFINNTRDYKNIIVYVKKEIYSYLFCNIPIFVVHVSSLLFKFLFFVKIYLNFGNLF